MKEAIILAGGLGKRLKHVVQNLPKPMALVDQRPFLRYVLDDLIEKGIGRIIIAVGYLKEKIIDYFGDNYRGVDILYSAEDIPLLTGGAVKRAMNLVNSTEVLVVNGDTYFDIDIEKLYKFKRNTTARCLIASHPMKNFDRYGTLSIGDDNFVESFNEKKYVKNGIINGGIYLLDKNYLDNFSEISFSLERDVFEIQVKAHEIMAFISNGFFIDIGVPEDYKMAQELFKTKHKKIRLFSSIEMGQLM